MLRPLRIAVSVVSGICCLLLIVLWVRSYQHIDDLVIGTNPRIAVQSFDQLIGLMVGPPPGGGNSSTYVNSTPIWSYPDVPLYYLPAFRPEYQYKLAPGLGFLLVAPRPSLIMVVPIWFAMVLTTAFGISSWPMRFPRRFGLRALLLTTTAVALFLGLIIYATRG